MSTPTASNSANRIALAAFLFTAAIYSVWIGVRFGFDHPPSATGDEVSYDSMAWELAHGRGFAQNVHDAEFRRPYHEAAVAAPELYSIPSVPAGPIAFRPPLLSLIFASTNLVAGRQFYLIRVFNVVCVAGTAGLICLCLTKETSMAVVALMMTLFWMDVRTRLYARTILTEPLACFLIAAFCYVLLRQLKKSTMTRRDLALLGVSLGLAVLTRTMLLVWLPGVLLLLIWVQRYTGTNVVDASKKASAVLLIALALIAPWGVRNVLILGRFLPTGTQGKMELSAAYSDVAWESRGVWQNLASRGWYDDVVTPDMSNLERELAIGDESSRRAFEWVRDNYVKLPMLALMKVAHELKPTTIAELAILVLSAIAILFARDRKAVALLSALILINLASVALTWSVNGRFLVPQLFPFYVLAGLGLHRVVSVLTPSRANAVSA